jgi:hypothetical protein
MNERDMIFSYLSKLVLFAKNSADRGKFVVEIYFVSKILLNF